MIKEKEMEKHYQEIDTEELVKIQDEFKWLLSKSILNTADQIHVIDKVLTSRGYGEEKEKERKILLVCACGNTRIVSLNCSKEQEKMVIFNEVMKPCVKCRKSNKYSWKYFEG